MPSLTTHLLSHAPAEFRAATQHPWLKLAGSSSLDRTALLAWLTQDRLYALNYSTFIGSLLSKISVPSTASRTETLQWRIVNLLIDALTNIRRELVMFEDVLRQGFNWRDGGEKARRETRAYADVFAGAAAPNKSLLEGMTVLWATEKCYLEAWRFARSQEPNSGQEGVMQKTLIPNWTCDEFVGFVETIRGLVDELGALVKEGGVEWQLAEDAWRQVLWAEEKFWPEVSS
ncbi:hypothetical protein AAFC00_002014 [Neodothiora populina]|uniref:Thiaminase-2/PQQC domain-containing protein n=1 Tax=Neodothiora populina TaxID=2781224 RepID=A0ABR3PH70_9PEZI